MIISGLEERQQQQRAHTKTVSAVMAAHGWQNGTNEDQVRIRVLKEGRAYTKRIYI